MPSDPIDSLLTFTIAPGRTGRLHSLARLEKAGTGNIRRLPVSLRIVLESLLRNLDGATVSEEDVRALAAWEPGANRTREIPFIVARIVLQDFTGVPLLVDLAAMRSAAARLGGDPGRVEPRVPVDLVVDHSVQVDHWSTPEALRLNMEMEFRRNGERYEFLKWGTRAFKCLKVVPPGIGIVHQVNLEHLARGVLESGGVWYPDTLVGTDSHTTMINGLGVVGWGVGGIEAEAGMLGQPVALLTPDVIGVHMTGRLAEGVTATDLALHCTEMLRAAKVVGTFVEFHGEGAASLPLPDRATIANMAPEYGATMGYFPVDEECCRYLAATGRSEEHVAAFRAYFQAQGMFGMPRRGECDYTRVLELDLGSVRASVSGPKRPQDRIDLPDLGRRFRSLLTAPAPDGGYGRDPAGLTARYPTSLPMDEPPGPPGGVPAAGTGAAVAVRETVDLGHGDVLIAAITSCTNTSNPGVMLAAGLLAKKAVERGLSVPRKVKASLAPGSRVVSHYLEASGLQAHLDRLGFNLVGYGCTTCIGNSGPLDPRIEEVLKRHDIVAASVLSGNRNFEARIQPAIRANFLMSPPLVVAFALAGRVDIDLTSEPIGRGADGRDVFLRDLWPSLREIGEAMGSASDPETYRRLYADFEKQNPLWAGIGGSSERVYPWNPESTYIQEPPFFEGFGGEPEAPEDLRSARALAIFGDSVTTDHISPAGAIAPDSPAGRYLQERGVTPAEFNSYGSRRGNDRVMTRGTFANVRIRNLMVPGVEGGVTVHQPSGKRMPIYDAAMRYRQEGVPLLVFAGVEYGTGSSRDWAAKGTRLLGVKAVIAAGYERIHRSNLIGMGVLPCQLPAGTDVAALGLTGAESFDLAGLREGARPGGTVTLTIHSGNGGGRQIVLPVRIDTPTEAEHYRQGGILPAVLRQILS